MPNLRANLRDYRFDLVCTLRKAFEEQTVNFDIMFPPNRTCAHVLELFARGTQKTPEAARKHGPLWRPSNAKQRQNYWATDGTTLFYGADNIEVARWLPQTGSAIIRFVPKIKDRLPPRAGYYLTALAEAAEFVFGPVPGWSGEDSHPNPDLENQENQNQAELG